MIKRVDYATYNSDGVKPDAADVWYTFDSIEEAKEFIQAEKKKFDAVRFTTHYDPIGDTHGVLCHYTWRHTK
jgi:hypothetical protein